MLNITHAESAILQGQARYKRWLAGFTEQWNKPAEQAVVLRWWDTMPPAAKEQARARFPEEFAEIERKVEGIRDKNLEE